MGLQVFSLASALLFKSRMLGPGIFLGNVAYSFTEKLKGSGPGTGQAIAPTD
jgi:hypothetical protein